MKIITTQEAFERAIAMVSKAVPTRPSHPILANILLIADADDQAIQVTGFDLALGITTQLKCSVEQPGSITLPAKLLNDMVSRLPKGEVILEAEQDDPSSIALTCQTGQYRMRGMAADKYPELPSLGSASPVKLPASVLGSGLFGVSFATSADESKQVLTGVHIQQNQDSTEFAATDGHRLAFVECPLEGQNSVEFAMTVPAKALREVERLLLQTDGDVAIAFDDHLFIAEQGEHRVVSRLLEGQYPAYRQLIPQSFQRELTVDRKALMDALGRVAVVADQKSNVVKFSIKATELIVSAEAADVGSATETIAAQVTGDPLEIAFNVKYLLEALKVMVSASITMRLNGATSPAIMMPLNGTKMIHLLMPIQTRS